MKKANVKNLTVLERILIPGILKKESDYKTLILNKDIAGKVQLTQDELKKYEVKVVDNQLVWNEKGVKALKAVEFTTMEELEIKLSLQKLDEEKRLSTDHITLYDKFVK